MTRPTSKIGSYDYTSLHPHIRKIQYVDYLEIILENLPDNRRGSRQ